MDIIHTSKQYTKQCISHVTKLYSMQYNIITDVHSYEYTYTFNSRQDKSICSQDSSSNYSAKKIFNRAKEAKINRFYRLLKNSRWTPAKNFFCCQHKSARLMITVMFNESVSESPSSICRDVDGSGKKKST
jgi:hypothetical protein